MTQTEFSSFKQLLKQVFTAHSSKVKELENEIKILKEKLAEKERENNASLTECKRCIELEAAFKSCKKALLDQSKLFENFGQKFSIFNSPGFENQDSKSARKSSNDSQENIDHPEKFKDNTPFLDENESALLSLEGNTITEIKINATDKVPVVSNKNLLKKVMHNDENLESFDVCTVTFPQHLKQGRHSAKFDSMILAPDSLEASLYDKKSCEKKSNENRECTNKSEFNEDRNLKSSNKIQDDKGSGKRLSSDSLNEDRIKRCNTGKQGEINENVEINSKLAKGIKNCSTVPPKITATQDTSDIPVHVERKSSTIIKDINTSNVSVSKKKNVTNVTVENKNDIPKHLNSLSVVDKNKVLSNETCPTLQLPTKSSSPKITITLDSSDNSIQEERKSSTTIKDVNALNVSVPKKKNVTNVTVENKNDTPKNTNLLNIVNKNKLPLNETSPSLLLSNANTLPKIIDLDDISNDNDDFQEQIPSTKNVQNEDCWDACDKKKSIKKKVIKNIKTTSKFKMTLDAPPANGKRTTYKQTKLSKSIFQPNNCTSNKKSPNRLSEAENVNPVVIEEDCSPIQGDFLTSTPYDVIKSPNAIDIDATFVSENFFLENRQCGTSSVKKNAIEKSHLKNGSLFSNISFPEELQSAMREDHIVSLKGSSSHSHLEDAKLKENMDSFDRLPLPEEPAYKYINDVVRKKSERKQLNGFDCKECEKYYSELGLSDKEKKERMKKCSRHRGKFTPPSTPDHFWELEFPDTEECKARGYMDKTQKVKLNDICNI